MPLQFATPIYRSGMSSHDVLLMNALIKLCIVMWDHNARLGSSYFHNTIARMKFHTSEQILLHHSSGT